MISSPSVSPIFAEKLWEQWSGHVWERSEGDNWYIKKPHANL